MSRARSARSEFAVTAGNARPVAEICTALEGLPLAIELAATRVGVLPPAALLERLGRPLNLLKGGAPDAPERQRTIRATIEWSYELLEPHDQNLLMRLAVFAGGCTLEAAESVCGDELDVVDGLASLTDSGLIRVEGTDEAPRFAMLETIREYAAERLEESGEVEELRRRHAAYFLGLAEEAEPNLRGSPGDWLDRLEREHDNFRAALDRLEAVGRRRDCSPVGSRTVAVLVPEGPPGGRPPASGGRPAHGRPSDGGPSEGAQRRSRDGGQHRGQPRRRRFGPTRR